MAIETTPLGFQKLDGNEPFRQGNDVISANAQKAQDLIAADKARLALLEQSAGFPGNPVELADDVVQVLVSNPESATATTLNATYVTFVDDATGLPLVDKHVTITVNATTNDITDILVEDI